MKSAWEDEVVDRESQDWIRKLNDDIWKRFSNGERYACRKLTSEEKNVVVESIWKFDLPCVMRSGPLGDLSMTVYGHSPFPEVQPNPLIKIHQDHLDLPTGLSEWSKRFDWFAQFTHRQRNVELATFYGLPTPRDKERYEY